MGCDNELHTREQLYKSGQNIMLEVGVEVRVCLINQDNTFDLVADFATLSRSVW